MADWKFGDILRREEGNQPVFVEEVQVMFVGLIPDRDGWFSALDTETKEIKNWDPRSFGEWKLVKCE